MFIYHLTIDEYTNGYFALWLLARTSRYLQTILCHFLNLRFEKRKYQQCVLCGLFFSCFSLGFDGFV